MTDTRPAARPTPAPTPPGAPARSSASTESLASLLAGVLALLVLGGASWFVIITAIVVMIFLHELGHYLTAKWAGMKVTEFFIGLRPRNLVVPAGRDRVRHQVHPGRGLRPHHRDEQPRDECLPRTTAHVPPAVLPQAAARWCRRGRSCTCCMPSCSCSCCVHDDRRAWRQLAAPRLGGAEPDEEAWTVGELHEGSAADEAGLEVGDDIVSIGGEPVAAVRGRRRPGGRRSPGDDRRRSSCTATVRPSSSTPPSGPAPLATVRPTATGLPRHLASDERLPTVHVTCSVAWRSPPELTAGASMGRTVTGLASFFTRRRRRLRL